MVRATQDSAMRVTRQLVAKPSSCRVADHTGTTRNLNATPLARIYPGRSSFCNRISTRVFLRLRRLLTPQGNLGINPRGTPRRNSGATEGDDSDQTYYANKCHDIEGVNAIKHSAYSPDQDRSSQQS